MSTSEKNEWGERGGGGGRKNFHSVCQLIVSCASDHFLFLAPVRSSGSTEIFCCLGRAPLESSRRIQ